MMGPMNRAVLLLTIAGCGPGLSAHGLPPVGDDDDLVTTDETETDADTDADADSDTDADADTDTDSDADADTDTDPPCVPPDLWDLGPQAPSGPSFAPQYVGVMMDGVIEPATGEMVDMSIDAMAVSAWVTFLFLDVNVNYQCQVIFDASQAATPTSNPPVSNGQTIFESYALSFPAASGWTDCGNMTGFPGYSDPRQWLADRAYWGVAYGEMDELRVPLAQAVTQGLLGKSWPADWATGWAPYVFAIFVDVGATVAYEAGWSFLYPHTCYDIASGTTPSAAPVAGPLDGYAGSVGVWTILNMSLIP